MFEQIQSPKIFTFDNLVAQMAEIFQGLSAATFLKPDSQELYESLADAEYLADYLSNSFGEHTPFVMEQIANIVDDQQANDAIVSYYNLFKQLHDAYHNYFEMTLIHPDSLEAYVRPLLEGSEQVQSISNHIDWTAITEEHAQNAEYIEFNYSNINFVGKWIVK